MIRMISEKKALKVLGGYYELLSKTGYVSHPIHKDLMAYMFMIDMVEYMHAYISQEDYKTIEKALTTLFANGGCLFSYPVFCTLRATLKSDKAILKKNKAMNKYGVRITEHDWEEPEDESNLLIVTV